MRGCGEMKNDRLIEMLREEAERKKKEDAEKAANPLLEYCTKAVIRYINGDVKEYKKYKDKALNLYHRQGYGGTVADEIPDDIKEKLYRMVK